MNTSTKKKSTWHILTPEYPPNLGGVSDYTRSVALGLAGTGDEVHVWGPKGSQKREQAPSLYVHDDLGAFSLPDLRRTGQILNTYPKPRHLLVQWVPHGYGYRSMNLHLCLWVLGRTLRHDDRVDLVVHEPALPFWGKSLRQVVPATIHRFMNAILLRAAGTVWMTIPAWEKYLRPYAAGRRLSYRWLPVPNNVSVNPDSAAIAITRQLSIHGHRFLLGHFGTHSPSVTAILGRILPLLLKQQPDAAVLLMGKASEDFRASLLVQEPWLSGRILATGILPEADLSLHLSACDLMLQPYPDGISTRRTSAMAALAHGRAMVTTHGHLTEDFWQECNATVTVSPTDFQGFVAACQELLLDQVKRERMGKRAHEIYQQRFDICHAVAALRGSND